MLHLRSAPRVPRDAACRSAVASRSTTVRGNTACARPLNVRRTPPASKMRVRQVIAAASEQPGAAAATEPATAPELSPEEAAAESRKFAERKEELIRGCRIILQELKGLDYSTSEAVMYFQVSSLLPKRTPKDIDMGRVRAALKAVMDSESPDFRGDLSALDDLKAMDLAKGKLTKIWSWRRRGGGMDDEEGILPHQLALADIDRLEKEDIDRVTSSLLDSLPITDAEKKQMSGSVQSATMGAINGAVWGSLAAGGLLLVAFNFLRSG